MGRVGRVSRLWKYTGNTMKGFREEEAGIKKDSHLSQNGIKWLKVQFSLSITCIKSNNTLHWWNREEAP